MGDPLSDIRDRDWLDHRWAFEIRQQFNAGVTVFDVVTAGCCVVQGAKGAAQAWIETIRPTCVAAVVSRHP